MGNILNSQTPKEYKKSKRFLIGSLYLLSFFFLLYCLVSTESTGIVGRAFSAVMLSVFGTASYIIPFVLLWFAVLHFNVSAELRIRINLILSLFIITLVSSFFSLTENLFGGDLYGGGGWIGDSLEKIFIKYLGFNFSVILIAFALIFLVTRIFRVSLSETASSVWHSFVEDIQSWKESRDL